MQFKRFRDLVNAKFTELAKQPVLFVTDVSGDEMWDKYLDSFPPGENPIFRERREYDCNTCKRFIRRAGNVVAIIDNKLVSIWDVLPEYPFRSVAEALSNLAKSRPVKDIFLSDVISLGEEYNFETANGNNTKWNHFHMKLPGRFVSYNIPAMLAEVRDPRNVMKRAITELSENSFETVLELIAQNSLYRGTEFQGPVSAFLNVIKEYKKLPLDERDNYCWITSIKIGPALSKIGNSAIGTLLEDLTLGIELDTAVNKFEKVMAPANYKRPTALITKAMIEKAEQKIVELGYVNSLGRRYAQLHDITVNNVIFVDRETKKAMSVFDELKGTVASAPKSFDKVEEISIENFIKNVVPTANSIEAMVENNHVGNFMSLVAPIDKEAPSMFKWNNNFSWAYANDVADSMKERVKAAGGEVDGVLRFSIQWNEDGKNNIDFDAHCIETELLRYSDHIYFGDCRKPSRSRSGGQLDVDIQSPGRSVAVENITWPDLSKMREGTYKFWVNNFSSRTSSGGFKAEIEFDGQVHQFEHVANLRGKQDVYVAEVTYSRTKGFSINPLMKSTTLSREVWGVNTNNFHKVRIMMYSPNHWDDQGVGNRHYFFMLEGCKNPDMARPFFNEFLKEELNVHRKVFEALAGKMRVQESEDQLSGLGFSSTQRNSLIVKVEGSTKRILKIVF